MRKRLLKSKGGEKMDWADVKPSFLSWVVVGLLAVTFIIALKYLSARFNIPGLTPLMQYV